MPTKLSKPIMNAYQIIRLPLLAVGLLLLLQCPVYSQNQQVDKKEAKEKEEEKIRPVVDLGLFKVKDYRPIRNETIEVTFHLHLALQKTTNPKTVEKLEVWKHRLRNQVLIAVRLALRQDFLEKDLHRFRRIVQLRVNRLLKAQLIDEVLLTEFTFSTS